MILRAVQFPTVRLWW